jgi:hypothetical protein
MYGGLYGVVSDSQNNWKKNKKKKEKRKKNHRSLSFNKNKHGSVEKSSSQNFQLKQENETVQ